jgi:hypothetical protein
MTSTKRQTNPNDQATNDQNGASFVLDLVVGALDLHVIGHCREAVVGL